jgi:hypothetical protein
VSSADLEYADTMLEREMTRLAEQRDWPAAHALCVKLLQTPTFQHSHAMHRFEHSMRGLPKGALG